MLLTPPPRFLIVDDHPLARQLLRAMLSRFGAFSIVEADDGETALKLLNSERFDIITIDMMMYPMDGAELYAKIEEMNSHSKHPAQVIGITANSDCEEAKYARNLGLVNILQKPVGYVDFSDTISDLLL